MGNLILLFCTRYKHIPIGKKLSVCICACEQVCAHTCITEEGRSINTDKLLMVPTCKKLSTSILPLWLPVKDKQLML